jgi:predicted RNA-binding Zn-ribbon protein involved in translation (DUF1610 family)
MASNTDRAGNLALSFSQANQTRSDLLIIAIQPAVAVLESMTEENESSEIAEEGAAKKGEVAGRSTRMFSVCPNCGARHNTVNDTKGVWICPDCGKPYDPY